MLIGYVSDEDYTALPDVAVDFERGGQVVYSTRSTATGAILGDLLEGEYRATLVKAGYGSKRVVLSYQVGGYPHSFRLLSDSLLGAMSPKWVTGGERAEFASIATGWRRSSLSLSAGTTRTGRVPSCR
ncbi:MAG: hypothetical protein NT023_19410 [Armatimonadetes bacterium]|nr:hypothetical protein [Armatimonadota bacterium]